MTPFLTGQIYQETPRFQTVRFREDTVWGAWRTRGTTIIAWAWCRGRVERGFSECTLSWPFFHSPSANDSPPTDQGLSAAERRCYWGGSESRWSVRPKSTEWYIHPKAPSDSTAVRFIQALLDLCISYRKSNTRRALPFPVSTSANASFTCSSLRTSVITLVFPAA
jgi:hypothetical protein